MNVEKSNCYLDLELLDDYLLRLSKTIVEQMFALYCQQVNIYLQGIESAQLNDSSAAWQEQCHKMKGATASIGMVQLHGKLKLIEKINATREEKAVILSELTLLNDQSIQAFAEWLDSK